MKSLRLTTCMTWQVTYSRYRPVVRRAVLSVASNARSSNLRVLGWSRIPAGTVRTRREIAPYVYLRSDKMTIGAQESTSVRHLATLVLGVRRTRTVALVLCAASGAALVQKKTPKSAVADRNV